MGIVWIASYPKSGNTWVRIFIENLIKSGEDPLDINRLGIVRMSSARNLIDEYLGIESSDLTPRESIDLRPCAFEAMAAETDRTIFMKIHDACVKTSGGRPMVSEKATRGAIYIIRNPLDVILSNCRFYSYDIDKAIGLMENDRALCNKPGRSYAQVAQPLMSWSAHVLSWADAPWFPVHVVSYESMLGDPVGVFTGIAEFAGLGTEPDMIRQAVGHASFDRLKSQERGTRFRETMAGAKSFFSVGKAGQWREQMTPEQVKRVVDAHGDVMRRFGYLDESGMPAC